MFNDYPAKFASFLRADKAFLLFYPKGCFPSSGYQGKRTVHFEDKNYLLGMTPEGFFALYPLNSNQGTPATIVILRLNGVDSVFTSADDLAAHLEKLEEPEATKEQGKAGILALSGVMAQSGFNWGQYF